jgi:hypothetical protein
VPLRHQYNDTQPKDIGVMLAEPRLVCHRMLGLAFAFEGAVAYQGEEPIVWSGKCAHRLIGAPPEQGFGAPIGRTDQTAVGLVRQVTGTMLRHGL